MADVWCDEGGTYTLSTRIDGTTGNALGAIHHMREETLRASLLAHEQELSVAVLCDVPVLITSERKDERSACARSLHARSLRRSGPFVEFDCGSASTPVAPGVFDARTGRRDGSAIQRGFDEAGGGTLFLDRIETMGSTLQQQLLLLLEEAALQRRMDMPAGMRRVRVIAGAIHALLSALGTGCLDESLFYRLNVIHIDFTSHQYLKGAPMNVKDLMSAPLPTRHPDADLGPVTMVMWSHDGGFVRLVRAGRTTTSTMRWRR